MARLTPNQKIIGLDGVTVGDFWSWAYSDIMVNTTRSVFAEFLVASALGVTTSPRKEWDAVDLRYQGKTIEVKAAAYLQSWKQAKPSAIKFDIGVRKAPWDADSATFLPGDTRTADCYVFCLYGEKDSSGANVLNLSAWQFYVLSTEQINRELATQRTVALSRIEGMCQPVSHNQLKMCVDRVLRIAT